MQFEVNGQVYVLAMIPPEGDLGLFAPTRAGLKRLLIYDDSRSSRAGNSFGQDEEPTVQ